MTQPLILAADVGTSACKVAVFDAAGRCLASRSTGYQPTFGPGNTAEQDPEIWWDAFLTGTRALLTAMPDVSRNLAGLAVAGQMSACLPIDADGLAPRPAMIWADQRATAETAAIGQRLGRDRIYAVTGNPVSETYPASKILWYRDHEPTLYARTVVFLQPKDFVVLRLTGRAVTEPSDASCTGLLDLTTRDWSPEILEALEIPAARLPEIVPSTAIVGEVTPRAAAQSGLPAGLPVVAGGGDGPAAAVGAGAVVDGRGYASIGTSAWLSFCRSTPHIDPRQRTFNYCHLVPGLYAPTGSMQSAGSSFDWWRRLGAVPTAAVAAVPPGADGLVFLPYLLGERTPYWNPDAAGAFIGLRPFHRAEHLERAVVEGIALHLALIHDTFAEAGVTTDRLPVIGGGADNPLLLQILADRLGRPVVTRSRATEATSLGAAICAAVGVGVLPSFAAADHWYGEETVVSARSAAGDLYRPIAKRFREAYAALDPYFRGWTIAPGDEPGGNGDQTNTAGPAAPAMTRGGSAS